MSKSVSSVTGNPTDPKPGFLNRVFNQTIDGKSVASALYAASGIAIAAGSLAFGVPAEARSLDPATSSGNTPIHVAVMAQGAARSDYGHQNLTVHARADSSNDFRSVHASPGSSQSRGAVATGAMLREMRIHTTNPIVIHAYDPFIKDAAGRQKLNLVGIREMAPLLAKSGVKMAMVSFSISNSPDGRQMSQIMKTNGIAVVAPVPDHGAIAAPDILTVQTWDMSGKAKPVGHFAVNDHAFAAVGRIAGTGAIYAQVQPNLRGSLAIGFEIQDRLERGANVVERKFDGMIRIANTVGAVAGVRIASPAERAAFVQQSVALNASGVMSRSR